MGIHGVGSEYSDINWNMYIVLSHGSVDVRGQTLADGDRVEGTLLDIDHIADFHDEAVRALFEDQSDDLTAHSRDALAKLSGLTGEGRCEAAYARCPGRLSPKMALGVIFKELGVSPGHNHGHWTSGANNVTNNNIEM
ncbi:uncharacterized protein LOC122244069 [Penaeus japonicus]|uniref:uncharacterized protein LOC122244069 n=1 Tax=Penaeus japonicus TaxID=27405 RepID=UPI001C71419D|nr:uncharacterized protein LOC122244069 [Penaeus japonicus]